MSMKFGCTKKQNAWVAQEGDMQGAKSRAKYFPLTSCTDPSPIQWLVLILSQTSFQNQMVNVKKIA